MMKKLFYLGSVLTMIFVAEGCDRNNIEPEDNTVTRILNVSTQTKTSLVGREIIWEKGDTVCCVAVYKDDRLDDDRYSLYCNIRPEQTSGGSAVIKVNCGGGYMPEYIIYPSSDAVSYNENGLLEIPVPASYVMRAGDVPKASNISVGTVTGDNVFMRNIMTLMKFEVEYPEGAEMEIEGIKQILVSSNAGEPLSGKLIYDPVNQVVTETVGTSKLYLYPPDDELYFPEGIYYFPIPSISLADGLKLKVSRMDEWVAQKSYDSLLAMERNSIINMSNTKDWELAYENTTRIIQAAFSTLDKQLVNGGWAFISDVYGAKDPGASNVCGKGLVGPFYLPENEDAEFFFYVSNTTDANRWRVTGGGGRRFGGNVHDYMLLPAIDGYRLSSVFIQAGTQKSTYAITDNPVSGDPTPLAGGEQKLIGEGLNHTFSLSDTSADTAYRLDLPTTTPSGIIEFKLTYEKE